MITFQYLQKKLPRLYSLVSFYLNPGYALPPFHAYFEVTYRCNLRCDMCHFLEIIEDTETHRTYKNELSAEEIKKAIAALPRFTVITFTGGEAFMKSDFMEVLEFAASRHKVHVITNGTMLNESLVERLMALRMKSFFGSGLFYVGVSIEGNEELHDAITTIPGSHRKTTQGLERVLGRRAELGARYPLVHLTCVINRENVRDLVPLYDYGARLGVNVCNLVMNNPATYWHGKNYNQADRLRTPPPPVEEIDPDILREELERLVEKSHTCKTRLRFSPNGITPEEIVRYYSNKSSYQDYRCFSAWAKVGVSAYGDVFSCPHYRLSNVQDHAGTIPWNGEAYRKFRAFLKQERIFPGCLGCCQSEYVGPDNRCRESSGSRIIDRWKGKLYESAASSAFGRE